MTNKPDKKALEGKLKQ